MRESYHHGDLRTALLSASRELLARDGLEKLSLRAVARAAGVSSAAPYRHFKDKHQLLAAVATEGFTTLARMIRTAVADTPDDLDGAGQSYLDFALQHPDDYRLMFTRNMLCDSDEENPELEDASADAYGALEEVIAAGVITGRVGAGIDADQLALAAWSMVHGVAMLVIDGILTKGPVAEVPPVHLLTGCQAMLRNGWAPQ